ncbi:MAG: class I SAM-dependent methyltransferase [bacterium]|nr:class I SAM-dependent methyltransferase [bacterium]
MQHEQYYYHNKEYTEVLLANKLDYFQKYLDYILWSSKDNDKILDVGCGPGLVAELSRNQKCQRNFIGLEISQPSVVECRKKQLNCDLFNGQTIPFGDESFSVVGSYNVLEHVENPRVFLKENSRVLKKHGHLIIVCPNFLSISNNYHSHTKGNKQKLKNIMTLAQKLLKRNYSFEKMATVIRDDFHSDDDACNITNPLDILHWARENNLVLKYWSSQPIYKKGVIGYLDQSFIKLFLGSCFFVFQKK